MSEELKPTPEQEEAFYSIADITERQEILPFLVARDARLRAEERRPLVSLLSWAYGFAEHSCPHEGKRCRCEEVDAILSQYQEESHG